MVTRPSVPTIRLSLGIAGAIIFGCGEEPVPCEAQPPIARSILQVDVTTGNASCALLSDGSITCWGEGREFVKKPPTGARFKQVTIGSHHGCALTLEGEAV